MADKVLMKGNEAIAEAAIIAGCHHYFGYPITPQTEIAAYMAKRLPKIGGVFLQAESEGLGTIEVEFIHDGRKKTAYFEKRSNDWIYTTWDVTIGEVPDIVKETLQNSYPDYVIEDINYVERPNANYYEFELEKGIIEITRYITPDGELL